MRNASRRARLLGAAILLLAAMVASVPGLAQTDPFYSTRLREGTAAYERGNHREAVESLRIACFGLLDEGPVLVECLVRLGLAQSALDDAEGFGETFQRLVEAEELLGLYGKAELPGPLRREFERAVQSRIPEAVLAASPGFRRLVGGEAVANDEPPEGGEEEASENGASEDGSPDPIAEDGGSRLREAREAMDAARVAGDLDRAYALVEDLLDDTPDDREARLLAGEIAYRGSRWGVAVEQFQAAGTIDESRCELRFYYAVALYETGRPVEAAEILRRCADQLGSTPFVDRYRELILGGGDRTAP